MSTCILIDPFLHSITVQKVDLSSFDHPYKLMECDMIEPLHIGNRQFFLLDEEGRLKERQWPFKYAGTTLFNKAIVVGMDDEGEFASTVLTVPDLFKRIAWYVDPRLWQFKDLQ